MVLRNITCFILIKFISIFLRNIPAFHWPSLQSHSALIPNPDRLFFSLQCHRLGNQVCHAKLPHAPEGQRKGGAGLQHAERCPAAPGTPALTPGPALCTPEASRSAKAPPSRPPFAARHGAWLCVCCRQSVLCIDERCRC